MDRNTIQELLLRFNSPAFHGRLMTDVSMAKCTTMRVGGDASLVIEPKDTSSLIFALRCLQGTSSPFVMGGGSNIIVSDNGFDESVISTRAMDSIQTLPQHEDKSAVSAAHVRCGAGTPMSRLVEYCTEQGLSGIEEFAGLPGTVGGAVYMNARCFGLEISDVLLSADYIPLECAHTKGGTAYGENLPAVLLQHYEMDKSEWQYKVSPFQGMNGIITSATFCLTQCKEAGAIDAIRAKCARYIEERRNKGHFRAPSAGSVFRNDRAFGKPSGALIDEAGLKGFCIGGAQIAPWHGNIIINNGTATECDIAALVKTAHDTVKERTGFDMQCEVVFCGALPSRAK